MKKRRCKWGLAWLLCISVLSIAFAGTAMAASQENEPANSTEATMNLAMQAATESATIPAIDASVPAMVETASFGLGWFWGIESQFGMIDGVIRTRVGYAGGRQANPDYHHMGDHTETVQVDYDPRRITYNQLLDVFWKSHTPTSRSGPRQYMRAVFYHDERQRELAMASKAAVAQSTERTINTQVVPLRSFTMAEDYHQKYLLKQNYPLKAEMTRIYPRHQDFVDSTAVARLNGYAGGHGSPEQFRQEIDRLGLSDAGKQALTETVERRWDYLRQ